MIAPHITDEFGCERLVNAWVKCSKCNGAYHRILPGKITPYWWCQDERQELKPGQEIEVEYIEPEGGYYASTMF